MRFPPPGGSVGGAEESTRPGVGDSPPSARARDGLRALPALPNALRAYIASTGPLTASGGLSSASSGLGRQLMSTRYASTQARPAPIRGRTRSCSRP